MAERVLNEYQMKLLSDIFRIIVKEIVTDEDKEKLAPGEIGVSYLEGSFYIRNPHTGELFSPNSVEHIKQILNNYNPVTGELNADRVNHIRFYTNISQLTQIGISLDTDTVIRQMTMPSVLYAPISYENYEMLKYPASKGLLSVIKINEEYVKVSFSDLINNLEYDGIYDSERHLFMGWLVSGTQSGDSNMGQTTTGGTTVNITYGKPISDLDIITVRVTDEILPGAKISVDGQTALPLVDKSGSPLEESIPANTIIMLVYDGTKNVWVYCDPSTDDVQSIVNQILAGRVTNVTVTPVVSNYLYTVQTDGTTAIDITGYDKNSDVLFINYGQTILRQGVDFTLDNTISNRINIINNINLKAGDQLFFQIVHFNATIG